MIFISLAIDPPWCYPLGASIIGGTSEEASPADPVTILAGISFLISKAVPEYTYLACSRHCETRFIGRTPGDRIHTDG